nr:hypothetical protein [Tanacetum cinerariifolium]
MQHILPPVMVKQPARRPKNTNCILSKGEAPSLDGYGRCGISGHNQNSCTQSLPSQQGTHRQKWMSNKTHMTQEHLTEEALLDEERETKGTSQAKYKHKFIRPHIVPVPFTEDAMGISEGARPAKWRQYSYNPMNNWMTHPEYSTNNTYDPSQPSTSQEAPSIDKSHPHRSTMSPTQNAPDRTTEARNCEMQKGDRSTSLNYFGITLAYVDRVTRRSIKFRGGLLGIKCTRHSHCQVKCSHWQYKFSLPVKVVATARRLKMPLPEVCTTIEEKKKELSVKDR